MSSSHQIASNVLTAANFIAEFDLEPPQTEGHLI